MNWLTDGGDSCPDRPSEWAQDAVEAVTSVCGPPGVILLLVVLSKVKGDSVQQAILVGCDALWKSSRYSRGRCQRPHAGVAVCFRLHLA